MAAAARATAAFDTALGPVARSCPGVAPDAVHPFVKVTRLPASDGVSTLRASHDRKGAAAVCRRQHDPGTPDKLARGVAVGEQNLKFSTVGGAKAKADVIASHASSIAHQTALGNLVSGG